MISSKHVVIAAVLAAPMLLVGEPSQAFTARQSTAGGQGIYATSQGMPSNFAAGASTAQPGMDGARGANQPRDLEHHGRYTAGS